MSKNPRFPGIDWHCDNCGAYLNSQKNFDDHKYIWKCTECGYKNSISWDNISKGDSKATQGFLLFLGLLAYVGLWSSIMLAVAIFGFGADRVRYTPLLIVFVAIYLLQAIVTLLIEFKLRHTYLSSKNMRGVIFRNLKEDFLQPFMSVKEIISNFLSFLTHKLPIKRKYVWHSNKQIVGLSLIYIAIAICEVVAFIQITKI